MLDPQDGEESGPADHCCWRQQGQRQRDRRVQFDQPPAAIARKRSIRSSIGG